MMMARPCFVALLCVALWCGMVFGQDETSNADPADPMEGTNTDQEVSADQGAKESTEAAAGAGSTTTTTTTTEGTSAAGGEASPRDNLGEDVTEMEEKEVDDEEGDDDDDEGDEMDDMEEDDVENEEVADPEASSSTDENGAATLSVSLSSLMIATLLAKVYAH